MTWEQLVIPVLLVLALLAQRMRMRRGTVEEAQGNEPKMTSVPVATKQRVPIRESRWQPQVVATARDMRRGIVLMAVLGPCRGLQPCSVSGELDRG